MNILSPFDVILLDMNGTFMFGGDRLGGGEDFAATYRGVGGSSLAPRRVHTTIRACCEGMAADYEDPSKYGDFPRVSEVLARVAPDLPAGERRHLEEVLALHELGAVPDEYAAFLRRLAGRHRLGLVANLWSEKSPWLAELRRAGVRDLFRTMVFSSDGLSIKPSPSPFRRALDAFPAGSRAVFVGDSLRCDIQGAKSVGLSTVWITEEAGHPAADHVVTSLLDLEDR